MADLGILVSGLFGAILGVILGSVLSYYFQILFNDYQTKRRKKFLATIFLNEIAEIKIFIEDLQKKEINSSSIIKSVDSNGFPNLNGEKFAHLMIILNNNPYFTMKSDDPMKKPFELFHNEIYSFEEPELIRDLILLGKMVNVAEKDNLQNYFEGNESSKEKIYNLIYFLAVIANINKKIIKIESDGSLSEIAT